MSRTIAGIDVHKSVLMVVIVPEGEKAVNDKRRFGTTVEELNHLAAWLRERKIQEVVMESTAQYWKPVWYGLEKHFTLSLAHAWSNRAPRGKKTDFKDAERLGRRHLAGELTLSFVPEEDQRQLRALTRRRVQLTRAQVRIQNQVESLLEETRIKLSTVLSDLFGASGWRMLAALADGTTDPEKLAALADPRVECSIEKMKEALSGNIRPLHCKILKQHLEQCRMIDKQLEELNQLMAEHLSGCQKALERLTQIPGVRVLAAQQIIAEAGATASAFGSASRFSSWIGVSPGRQESAEKNRSARTAKGNVYLRSCLCQCAQAAVRTKNCFFQQKFKRLLPRLGYPKAIWAIARHLSVVIWHILNRGAEYIEHGGATTKAAAIRKLQRIKK